jgi:hypothetical protein
MSCIIGGPDGLDPAIRARADLILSFGALTLPHQLVRVLVMEQLYRALTILAGHPTIGPAQPTGEGQAFWCKTRCSSASRSPASALLRRSP